MLAESVTGDRSWTRDSLSAPSPIRFSDKCLKRLMDLVRDHSAISKSITEMVIDPSPSDCHVEVARVLDGLENGPGFVVVQGFTAEQSTVQELMLFYWAIGQLLGDPFGQTVRGTLLYDVRDEGGEVANGARFSTFGTRPAKSRMVPAFRRSGRGRRSREWCPLFDVRDEAGEVANGARFSTFGTRPAKSRMVPAFRRSGRGRRSREWCPLFDDEGRDIVSYGCVFPSAAA